MTRIIPSRYELLAPAGQPDCVRAALNNGADSIYLGMKALNARRNAKNFDYSQLKETVEYCHLNGAKVYLTLNTIAFDEERKQVIETLQQACELGLDAVIVQDIGVASLVKQVAPELRLHGSTQMSIHTRKGAEFLKEQGFSRVVLSREMSLEEIRDVAKAGIELEAFVHGALCMCVSGQCYMSGMLGGRSANRGMCAQPCRLPFSAGAPGRCDLSLKDLSAVQRIPELLDAGVYSLKIEGRMKRPEYVAAAVSACKAVVDGNQPNMEVLQSVFSRSGFTDGYLDQKLSPQMFGVRSKEDVTAASAKLLKQLENTYQKPTARIPVWMKFQLKSDCPSQLTLWDQDGNQAHVSGVVPETAKHVALTEEKLQSSLGKLGGTAFYLKQFQAELEDGLSLPVSVLNGMRREAVQQLEQKRSAIHPKTFFPIKESKIPLTLPKVTSLRVEFERFDQIPLEFMDQFEWIGLKLEELSKYITKLAPWKQKLVVIPPRAMFGIEQQVIQQLEILKQQGIQDLLVQNLAQIQIGKQLGYRLHGGFGLNIANSMSIAQLEEWGFQDCVVSPELTAKQMKILKSSLPCGILAGGYLPLMLTRNCPIKNQKTCRQCKRQSWLTDRKGKRFRVACSDGYSEIYNSDCLWIADRIDDFTNISFFTLKITLETPEQSREMVQNFLQKQKIELPITKGLYYRGVL